MPNRRYQKGTRLEYDCMNYLIERGYYPIRAYASRGLVDVIAVRPVYKPHMVHYPLMIECKTNNYLSPSKRQELKEGSEKYQGWILICYRDCKPPRKRGDLCIKFRTLTGEIITNI